MVDVNHPKNQEYLKKMLKEGSDIDLDKMKEVLEKSDFLASSEILEIKKEFGLEGFPTNTLRELEAFWIEVSETLEGEYEKTW